MWIEMLQTWTIPPDRMYLKGSKYDLPENILKQIRAKRRQLWKPAIASWLDASIIPNFGVAEQPPVDAGAGPEVQD